MATIKQKLHAAVDKLLKAKTPSEADEVIAKINELTQTVSERKVKKWLKENSQPSQLEYLLRSVW